MKPVDEIDSEPIPNEPDPQLIKEGTVGLEDELTEKELEKVRDLTKEALEEIDAYNIDTNLDEDVLKVSEQNYAVI
jgi:hypothetical protein